MKQQWKLSSLFLGAALMLGSAAIYSFQVLFYFITVRNYTF
jgi:hypothetical protein